MKKLLYVPILLVTLLMSSPAFAGDFVKIPGYKDLVLHIVGYDGNTNGEMIVEVKNTGKTLRTFDAVGIFFVPTLDADEAPQRLGAAGPSTEVMTDKKRVHHNAVPIAAGQVKRLNLEVFCIDSHRASPTSKTPFTLAKKLLPKQLAGEIRTTNKDIYRANGNDVKKAKGAIQDNMWMNRDKAWIPVEGEGVQEAVK